MRWTCSTPSRPTIHKNPINVSVFPHNDFTFKHKRFSIFLDVSKLGDSDDENVRDLNAKEFRKDGLESKSIEKTCVPRSRGSTATC